MRQRQCLIVITKTGSIHSFHSWNKFTPPPGPLEGKNSFRSKSLDLRMRQTRTGRDTGWGSQPSVKDAQPHGSVTVGGPDNGSFLPCLLHYQLRCGRRKPDSPEKGSRLSVHPDLHVLEPGQAKGKRLLMMGSAGPSPFGGLDHDLQTWLHLGKAQPFPEQGWNPRAWVGWQELCRQGNP